MANINKTIDIAKNLILNGQDKEKYMLYPYTTENLVGLFQQINVSGKDCLTINGSFDQSLDMALLGAKSITAFDINPLTIPYAELKIALILTGYREDIYFKFLNSYYDVLEEYAYHPKIFEYIKKNLSEPSLIFWQDLMNSFNKREIGSGLLYDGYPYYEQKEFVNYMQDNNYQKLQKQLPNTSIELLEENIVTLSNCLTKSYDIMYFSNIICYPNPIYDGKNYEEKLYAYKEMIDSYSTHLNKEGKIISYIYDPFNNQGCDEFPIFDQSLREKVFSGDEYSYIYFPSYFTNTKDGCLVYTKK